VVGTFLLAAAWMALAMLVSFPGARFGVGTFGVSVLPALALLVAVTSLGVRRR
jgi:hypothetical protein